jgi:hypothetical protein
VEWKQFQENIPRMAEYLDGNNSKKNPIIINKIIINFTIAYGARALLLTYRENDQEDRPSENTSAAEEASRTPKKNLLRRYSDAGSYFSRTAKQLVITILQTLVITNS